MGIVQLRAYVCLMHIGRTKYSGSAESVVKLEHIKVGGPQ